MSKKIQKKEGGAKKALKIVAGILVAVIILGTVGIYTFLNSGYMERNTVAAKSEHYTVTTSMLSYLYNTNYQNFVNNAGSYLEALGLDTSLALEDQKYSGDTTWHDYMLDSTRSQLTSYLTLCEAALTKGVSLDDEDKADIDDTISTMATYAEAYDVTLDYYIKNIYGSSVTEEDIRACLEILLLAEKYQTDLVDTYEFTSDDWAAYFEEHEEDFLKVDYLKYTFEAETEEDDEDHDADDTTAAETTADTDAETTADDTTAAEDEASEPDPELAYAEALAATVDADAFRAYVKNYLTNVKYANMTEEELEEDEIDIDALVEGCLNEGQTVGGTGELNEWLSDDARDAYEIYTDFDEEDGEYTVYMILPAQNEGDLDYNCKYRETYLLKDYRYIPVAIDSDAEDAEQAMTDAKADAEDILEQWNDDPTDEKFAELASADNYGDGNYEGGLVEAADKGTINDQVSEWVFADERQAGDTAIIEVEEEGCYILYFKGDNTTSWEYDADSALKSEKYSEDYEAYSNLYPVTYYKKGVGLVASA